MKEVSVTTAKTELKQVMVNQKIRKKRKVAKFNNNPEIVINTHEEQKHFAQIALESHQ